LQLVRLILAYQVIPRAILERANGFAIFTIIKAGFLFSARGGAGIVIARLENGCEPLSLSIFLMRDS
jgi:lipid-binding SYLF domain-containing protein